MFSLLIQIRLDLYLNVYSINKNYHEFHIPLWLGANNNVA